MKPIIESKEIIQYRKALKKIGISDKDYASVKSDVANKISIIEEMDRVVHITGSSLEQIKLATRLILYGDSTAPMSEEDVKICLLPLENLKLNNTPNLITRNIEDFVNNILPLPMNLIDSCDSEQEINKMLSSLIAKASDLWKKITMHTMSLGICLRKYPETNEYIQPLTDSLYQLVSEEDKIKIRKFLNDTADRSVYSISYRFSTIMAVVLVNMNLFNGVSLADVSDFYDKLDEVIAKSPTMKRFVESEDFNGLVEALGKDDG